MQRARVTEGSDIMSSYWFLRLPGVRPPTSTARWPLGLTADWVGIRIAGEILPALSRAFLRDDVIVRRQRSKMRHGRSLSGRQCGPVLHGGKLSFQTYGEVDLKVTYGMFHAPFWTSIRNADNQHYVK